MISVPEYRTLRTLWSLAGPLRWRTAHGIAWRVAQSMCLGLAVATTLHVLPGLLDGGVPDERMIAAATALMALSLAGQLLCGFRASRASWLSSFEVAGALRLAILDRVRQLPIGFHLSRHRADTLGGLTTDIQTLETLMAEAMPRLGQIIGLPIALFAWLLWTDPLVGVASGILEVLNRVVNTALSMKIQNMARLANDEDHSQAPPMDDFWRNPTV